MAEVVLAYRAPVYVTVDTDKGEVVRVECADTEVEAIDSAEIGFPDLVDGDAETLDATHRRAAAIAAHDLWPAWRWL